MMTGVGMLLGTAAYMRPEQAKGREADKRSDIWAFGCVLYEMLTGRRAFDGDDIDRRARRAWSRASRTGRRCRPTCRQPSARCCKDVSSRIVGVAWRTSPRHCSCWIRRRARRRRPRALSAAPLPRRPLWRASSRPVALRSWLPRSSARGLAWHAPGEPAPPRVSRLLSPPSGAAALTRQRHRRDLGDHA